MATRIRFGSQQRRRGSGFGYRWLKYGLLVLVLGVASQFCLGQPQKSANSTQKKALPTADSRLEATPFEAEALGLKINLPARANVIAEKINGNLVISVSDDPTTPTWTMRIQSLLSTLDKPSAAGQLDQLMQEFKTANQRFEVITNQPYIANGMSGQLCYLKRTVNNDQQVISGWLLLPTSDKTFMVFALQTLPEHMNRIRPVIEASFATIQLRNAEEIASERKSQLDAGLAFIQSVTPAKLRAQLGVKQWYRIYTPASDGSVTERGYSLLEVFEAKKGELDPGKPAGNYDKSERQTGLMVRIQGRVVVQAETNRYYDSIALYWMAWDQSEEAWSIRGTERQGEAERSEAETGVRTPYIAGGLPPRLNVIKSVQATNEREPYDWDVPDIYLSQPIGWLLGRLLPKDVAQDQEFRYYFYNFANRSAQLSQRDDVWGPMPDGSGNFRLVTKLTSDTPAMTSIYDKNGELVKRIHPDGSITEPTPVETIRKLWVSKKLQIGTPSK